MMNSTNLTNKEFLILLVFFIGCASYTPMKKTNQVLKLSQIFDDLEQKESNQTELKPVNGAEEPKILLKSEKKRQNQLSQVYEFEETGEGIASKYERIIEAEKRAEENALEKAIKSSGVDVYYGFHDILSQYNKTMYQFVARYFYLWSGAIIEYERISKPVYKTLPTGEIECIVALKGKIHRNGVPDPAYEIQQVSLNQPEYFDGDKLQICFRATKDSYVQILAVDEEQNVTLIFPNIYTNDNFIKAGEFFKFPDEKSNLELKAILPENKKETTELIHIILTKNMPIFTVQQSKETLVHGYTQLSIGDLSSVSRKLAKLSRSDWTMKVIPYGIRAR
jgi:hypothetical protein